MIDSRFLTTLTRGQKVGLPRARGVAKSGFGAPRRSFRLALPLLQYTVDDSLGQPTDTTIASSRRPANLVSPLSWQVRGSPSPPAPRPPRSGWAWQPDHPLPFHAATPAEDRLPGPGHSTSVYAAPRQPCAGQEAVRHTRRTERGTRARCDSSLPSITSSRRRTRSVLSCHSTGRAQAGRVQRTGECFATVHPRTETCEGLPRLETALTPPFFSDFVAECS